MNEKRLTEIIAWHIRDTSQRKDFDWYSLADELIDAIIAEKDKTEKLEQDLNRAKTIARACQKTAIGLQEILQELMK